MHRSLPTEEGHLQACIQHSFTQQAFLQASHTSGSMLACAEDQDLTLTGTHFQGAPILVGDPWAETVPAQGDWKGTRRKKGVGAQSGAVRDLPQQERLALSPEE